MMAMSIMIMIVIDHEGGIGNDGDGDGDGGGDGGGDGNGDVDVDGEGCGGSGGVLEMEFYHSKKTRTTRSINQEICKGRKKSPFPESGEAILSRKCQEIRLDQNHQHLASFQKAFFYRLFASNRFSA